MKNNYMSKVVFGLILANGITPLILNAETVTNSNIDDTKRIANSLSMCSSITANEEINVPCDQLVTIGNGDFELPANSLPNAGEEILVDGSSMDSWKTEGQVKFVNVDGGSKGPQMIELAGNTITQEISVVPGQLLEISFDMKKHFGQDLGDDIVSLRINDEEVLSASTNSLTWDKKSVIYQVPTDWNAGDNITLSLSGIQAINADGTLATDQNITSGNLLDNVQVKSETVYDNFVAVDKITTEDNKYMAVNVLKDMNGGNISSDSYLEYKTDGNLVIDTSSVIIDGINVKPADVTYDNGIYKISNLGSYFNRENQVITFEFEDGSANENTKLSSNFVYKTAGFSEYNGSTEYYNIKDSTNVISESRDADFAQLSSTTNEKPVINAKNITMHANGTYSAELEDVLKQHKAYSYDVEDGNLTSNITVAGLDAVDLGKAGVYPLTFSATDSAGNTSSVTRNVTLLSEDSQLEKSGDLALHANDFITNLATIKENNEDLSKLISYIVKEANIKGFNIEDGTEASLNFNQEQLQMLSDTDTPGEYKLDIIATHGDKTVTKTITIPVLKNDDTLDEELPYINTNHIIVNQGDEISGKVSSYGIFGYDKKDKNITESIKAIGLDKVDTSKAGIHGVTLELTDSDGNTTSKDISVIVKDHTYQYENGDYVIQASEIPFEELQLGKQSAADLKNYIINSGKVKVINVNNGEEIDYTLNEDQLSEILSSRTLGLHKVDISATAEDGQVVKGQLKIFVLPTGALATLEEGKPFVHARDAHLALGKKYGISLHNPFAYDLVDGDLTDKIQVSGIDKINTDKAGKYEVTFSVTNEAGTTSTMKRNVVVVDVSKLSELEKEFYADLDLDGVENPDTDGTTDENTDGTTDGNTDGTTDGSTDETTDGSTDETTDGTTDENSVTDSTDNNSVSDSKESAIDDANDVATSSETDSTVDESKSENTTATGSNKETADTTNESDEGFFTFLTPKSKTEENPLEGTVNIDGEENVLTKKVVELPEQKIVRTGLQMAMLAPTIALLSSLLIYRKRLQKRNK